MHKKSKLGKLIKVDNKYYDMFINRLFIHT